MHTPSVPAPALIVRHDPAHRDAAVAEARRILAAIGEPDAIVHPAAVEGNLKIIPEGDPHAAQRAVAGLLREHPDAFRYTSSWTAVDRFVPSDLESIRRAVAVYQEDLAAAGSWKVAVRHAGSDLHRDQVIRAVAPLLGKSNVDLERPKKEVRIDILGAEAGVGLVDRGEFFEA